MSLVALTENKSPTCSVVDFRELWLKNLITLDVTSALWAEPVGWPVRLTVGQSKVQLYLPNLPWGCARIVPVKFGALDAMGRDPPQGGHVIGRRDAWYGRERESVRWTGNRAQSNDL